MPSLYTENSEKWKNLASIDYFTQFVKAWIPFNAWYKNYYPNLKTDRETIDDLISQSDFKRLSEPQQSNLKACYEAINPSKPISLLSHDLNNCIQMGNLHFVNDLDKLCKDIIEILYKLRNVLFHGEIIPDFDTNKVYEPAYQILYTLIQAL